MSSHRTAFARQAEINRCVRLIDHYAAQGWGQRCERVFRHLLRLWPKDATGPIVTRKWWMAKATSCAR